MTDATEGIESIVAALTAAWRAGSATDAVAAPHLAKVLARLGAATSRYVAPPTLQPVVRHVEGMPPLAGGGSEALARAIAVAADALAWRPPYPELKGDPSYARFLDGYSYVNLAGPQGPVVTPDLGLFVTIQAPGITYPAHRHDAFEVYYVIAGRGEWKRGDESWTVREPGTFVVHGSQEAHAMRTGAEPLLAAAAWLDHLDGPSLMVPA
jgi:mannose-6-phosphate isomerase-like protein (cupin superfamily)